MQNQKLILISVTAIVLVGSAIYFHSSNKIETQPPPIAVSEKTPTKIPHLKTVAPLTNPADQTLTQLRDLLTQDPTDQNGHAAELLNDLCSAGQFETALKAADIISSDMRPDWLKII